MNHTDNTDTTRRSVLITGAADGIGWATACCMARAGWRVALMDRDAERVHSRARELGADHIGLPGDVTDAASAQAAVAAAHEAFTHLGALVNNAGIGDQTVGTLEQNADAFDRLLAVHLRGSFLMSQAGLARMQAQTPDARGQRGAIVNLGSIASLGGIPGRNAYSAAKAGLLGMTRAMAMEWARRGIRVNAVAPGYVSTELVASLAQRGALDLQTLERRTPLGRLAAPDEVAQTIAFLASPAASYVTGATLSVDGGWSALGAPESALIG